MWLTGHSQFESDHRYLRRGLELLQVAVSSRTCPPPGHVFYSMLEDAVQHFTYELPRHMAEEEQILFPGLVGMPGTDELPALMQEHAELREVGVQFAEELERSLGKQDEQAWQRVQEAASRFARLMRAHMVHEEEVVYRILRANRQAKKLGQSEQTT